jgi:BatD DUF11 like domain
MGAWHEPVMTVFQKWVLDPWHNHRCRVLVTILCLLALFGTTNALGMADGMADPALAYETVEPARIRLGDSAVIRVTSLDGYLRNVPLPKVPGLTFEFMGRSQGFEFFARKSTPANYILIRVTPQFTGVFSIPGLTPNSKSVGLEVVSGNEPNPYAFHNPTVPKPVPVAPAPIPKGLELKAGGAAFVQMVVPKRAVYVGESVPIDIEVGIRPGIVTSLNGPPTLSSSDFTLNNLSQHPARREQDIGGTPFEVLTWHTVLAPVKPGDFSVSVEAPLSVRDTKSAEDAAFASKLGWPLSQIIYNAVAPKDETVASPKSEVKVLALPEQGRPKDFSGAVGDFRVSSDISPASVAVGEPQTLRLRVSGAGNFDRVASTMLDHLEHWKTYPVKSAFTPKDAIGYSGEKVFEQPLIAQVSGEQSIPAIEFSYFNPNTRQYERAHTQPIEAAIATSLADRSAAALTAAQSSSDALASPVTQGLRPDHPRARGEMGELRPLYFQAPFLAASAAFALILAGSFLVVRPNPRSAASKAVERALARLSKAAQAGDAVSFFEMARQALVQTFATRWQILPDQITAAELKARLGSAGEDIEQMLALADEAKYSDHEPGAADFQRWLELIRCQLKDGKE